MKVRQLQVAFLLSLILVTIKPPVAQGSIWTSPVLSPAELGTIAGWELVDSFYASGESVSRILQRSSAADPVQKKEAQWRLCSLPGQEPCTTPEGDYSGSLLLPHCESLTQEWCIETLKVGSRTGSLTSGKFLRQVEGRTTPSVKNLGFPAGSTISLWEVPGAVHGGGNSNYAAYVNIRISKGVNQPAQVTRLNATILPYTEITGVSARSGRSYTSPTVSEQVDSEGNYRVTYTTGSAECAWMEPGRCGLVEEFPRNISASLTIRVSKKITGWLMGRLAQPEIRIRPFNSDQNTLEVIGEAVDVPQFFAYEAAEKLTPQMKKTFEVDGFIEENPRGLRGAQTHDSLAFDVVKAWQDVVSNEAAGVVSTWSFATTNNGSGSKCLKSERELLGLVTTNSMVYEGIAPSFSGGFINYKVAGMHFNPDKSIFKGSYDLLIRKTTARCLYGLKDVPMSATVTVASDGIENRIETSSLVEFGQGADTWVKVSARDFTFSAPLLKVKISPSKSTSPSPSKSILCIKGKTTQKVTGTSPKCPSGFKKK